jgi:hypothetical protein
VERHGVEWREGVTDAEVELWMAFDCALSRGSDKSLREASGFLGAFEHLHRAIDLIWNKESQLLIWNDWSEEILSTMIEAREWTICGPSSSWKSTCAAVYACCFLFADPLRSKVIISSTTLGGLRERIWKDILHFYRASRIGYGGVVQHPTPKIQVVKGDDGSGIHGVAVEQGDLNKAIDKIKGRHAPNVLVVIDELTGALPAIVDVCTNLESGCERFQLGGLQNPCSYFDQGGRLAEPATGWNSITVESESWETLRGGKALHLNGRKSPNVLAGSKKYPGLLNQDDMDTSARRDGENSPRYWQERLGFWPPEGITKTILSESMIVKFKVREPCSWIGETKTIAALDPAYEGGDRKVLGFARVGETEEDGVAKTVLCFYRVLCLKLDVTSKEPLHFQLKRQVVDECLAEAVDPQYFGMDVTGEGGGTADILKREWSTEFLCVSFAGRASDRPVSEINPRKCYEEYFNRVSELWYQVRRACERGQIRGMPVEMATEFCSRFYEMRGSLIMAEPKTKMKLRLNRSPDYADMGAVMVETAIDRGLLPSAVTPTRARFYRDWVKFARAMAPRSEYDYEEAIP